MVNVSDYEEDILIEAADFNYQVWEVLNLVMVKDKAVKKDDRAKAAALIIASMVERGLITVVKSEYRDEGDDCYSPVSSRELSPDELKTFLENPDSWEQMGVYSETGPYELAITGMGRREYNNLAFH
jgi:G:T/U-mismatch repair DNA glycosylase